MQNKDTPAAPTPKGILDELPHQCVTESTGLTKREQFCLTMGVAETGDKDLDAIIRKGNEQKLAGLAMQGILSGIPVNEIMPSTELASMHAADYAKALLQQLEGGEDE